jgi:hypothetical protein
LSTGDISVSAETATSAAAEGERKTVTELFADIKGSIELMEDLEQEEPRAIVDPALRLMIDAARPYDGHIVQSTGDGIFALFGAPIAHEDHPQRCWFAALRLQEQLSRYSSQLRGATLLAACNYDQVFGGTRTRGCFTQALLDVIKGSGFQISPPNLLEQARQAIKKGVCCRFEYARNLQIVVVVGVA